MAASGDITLEMAAEFSLLGDDRNVGSAGNPINVPTFLSRNVIGVLRLRDGETGLIGGLLQGRESASFAGAIGMNSIPVLGKLFGNRQKSQDETEVVISITPRIVRAPKVTEEDLVPLRVGTQEVPKVRGRAAAALRDGERGTGAAARHRVGPRPPHRARPPASTAAAETRWAPPVAPSRWLRRGRRRRPWRRPRTRARWPRRRPRRRTRGR